MKPITGLPTSRATVSAVDAAPFQLSKVGAEQSGNSFSKFLTTQLQTDVEVHPSGELKLPTPPNHPDILIEDAEINDEFREVDVFSGDSARAKTQVLPPVLDVHARLLNNTSGRTDNLDLTQAAAPIVAHPAVTTEAIVSSREHTEASASYANKPMAAEKPTPLPASPPVEINAGARGDKPLSVKADKTIHFTQLPTGGSTEASSQKESANLVVEGKKHDAPALVRTGILPNLTNVSDQAKEVKITHLATTKPAQIPPPIVATINTMGLVIVQNAGQTEATQITTLVPQAAGGETEVPTKSIAIQLMPKTLGVVEIKITQLNGRLDIRIQTQTETAERLLQTELKSIVETLRGASLTIGELSITNNPQLELPQHHGRQHREGNLGADSNFTPANDPNDHQEDTGQTDWNGKDSYDQNRDNELPNGQPQTRISRSDGIYF